MDDVTHSMAIRYAKILQFMLSALDHDDEKSPVLMDFSQSATWMDGGTRFTAVWRVHNGQGYDYHRTTIPSDYNMGTVEIVKVLAHPRSYVEYLQ
jgi:hypothetical protein